MADYSEEQAGELETLACIYGEEELKVLSENPYSFQLSVSVEDSDEEGQRVSVLLLFSLPPSYPDAPPQVKVTGEEGLEEEEEEEEVMERAIMEQATENLGTVMVYTLVCAVQEKIAELQERRREERERERREREEEEKRLDEIKYRGTIVTVENFGEWRKRFDEERRMAWEGEGRGKETSAAASRLSGRQMFERDASLSLSDAQFLTDTGMEPGHAGVELGQAERELGRAVEVDESLFQNMGDLALEDDT